MPSSPATTDVSRPVNAALRLRGAGVGSIVGGIVLAALAFVGAPYALAGVLLLSGGGLAWLGERRHADSFESRPSVGVVAVGGIALLEAVGIGIGLPMFLLAGIAVGAGVVDIVLGLLFGRLRDRMQAMAADEERR